MSKSISRQQFLKYTASAGAAILLASLEGFAAERPGKKSGWLLSDAEV